jgi:hypothetical protein
MKVLIVHDCMISLGESLITSFLNGFETIKSGYLMVNDNLVAEL